ncbi:MAG: ATP-binding protein [Treponema sp.]|nr:ATP-binding protein [Treponema sp.]
MHQGFHLENSLFSSYNERALAEPPPYSKKNMYYNKEKGFNIDTAELACVFIEKYKCWQNTCISLHPNIEAKFVSIKLNEKGKSLATIEIKSNHNYDLFQKEGLNIKVIVGKNGCGKTTILEALRNNFSGAIAILKDSQGNFASNKEINIKKSDSIILLKDHDYKALKNISDGGLLQNFANNDSSNTIKEELFAFRYNFFPIYLKNKELYNFEKGNPLFTHFTIKPRHSFSDIVKMYWQDKYKINDYDFEECLIKEPFLIILLYQINSEHYIWEKFHPQRHDIVSFKTLLNYLDKNIPNNLKDLQTKYTPLLKELLIHNNTYKCHSIKNFPQIKRKWESPKGILQNLYNDLKIKNSFFNEPISINLDLFYYDGIKKTESNLISFDDFSAGEQQSLRIRYLMYPGLTQLDRGHGFWMVYDEPEEHLHPEWCRQFISNFIKNFKHVKNYALSKIEFFQQQNSKTKQLGNSAKSTAIYDNDEDNDIIQYNHLTETIDVLKKRTFSVIIATHSPFLLSDLFGQNIIYLKKKDQHPVIINSSKNTFAANIGEMFYDSFFMRSTIGEFAESKLKELIRFKQSKNPSMLQSEADAILKSIGDPVIRSLIEEIEANDD